MQKALTKTGVMMKHQCLVLEAACSTDNNPSKTVIPDLIGFPDVPASLVKNPIRTVMIKELTPNISSSDIEKALAFCGSNVSGFFFGSSSSVAYVEFEVSFFLLHLILNGFKFAYLTLHCRVFKNFCLDCLSNIFSSSIGIQFTQFT